MLECRWVVFVGVEDCGWENRFVIVVLLGIFGVRLGICGMGRWFMG